MTDGTNNPTNDPAFDIHDEDELHEIHEFDFGRAYMLMGIAEKVATVAPKCTSLLGIAQAELEVMNQNAKDIALRRAEKAKAMEQRRYEAEQERVRKDNEAQAAAAAADDGRPKPKAIPASDFEPGPDPAPVPNGGMPSPERRL